MESFFHLFLLHISILFVPSDSAACLSRNSHFGKGCTDQITSCANQAFRSQMIYVQLKRNQSNEKVLLGPGKSFLREGEGTIMDSENQKAMIINGTDNDLEQSTDNY